MKLFAFILLSISTVFAACTQKVISEPVAGKLMPLSGSEVELLPSWIKSRESLNTEYLKSLDPERLLHNFRVNAGLPSGAQPLEGWEAPWIGLRGHFTGHYLSALSSLVERYQDPVFTDRLNYMVEELDKCRQALGNGYLSAFPEGDFDRLEKNFGGVWAPYYTYHKIMQGLLDVYTRTGNELAYSMVTQMADYVEERMSKLDPEAIDKILYSVGANPANEAGAMNEVLYRLYKVSGNPRHLTLAKIFDRDWFAIPLAGNKNILNGLHSNTHIVLVNGFAQRYSITQEAVYRDAALNFWDMLMNKHAYANGSSSGPRPNVTTPTSLTAEHWGVPGVLSNTMTKEIAESCVSHNTQKLTSELFCWTKDPLYAESYMNTFYNAVMASQNAHTGECVYHLPLGSPRNKVFLKEDDFRCCNGTGIEAFASLNSGIYYCDEGGLWVNLYIPSRVNWKEKDMALEQAGNFPDDPVVEFILSTKNIQDFDLNFLIPSWTKSIEVYINGEKQVTDATPQSYLTLSRKWNDKDKIKLVFHTDFYLKSMPDDDNVIAIFYGPALLAFETYSELILKGTHSDILENLEQVTPGNYLLSNNGKEYRLRSFYDVVEESYGVYATLSNLTNK